MVATHFTSMGKSLRRQGRYFALQNIKKLSHNKNLIRALQASGWGCYTLHLTLIHNTVKAALALVILM